MQALLKQLRKDFKDYSFVPGKFFCWSPEFQQVMYKSGSSEVAKWSLLHELAHATLEHKSFTTDIELLLMEVAAWDKAKDLALQYGQTIDEDHIQDCIDTYRDWLDARSTCPECMNNSLQIDERHYGCHNCSLTWGVGNSRFSRPYRLKMPLGQIKKSSEDLPRTTFI